ncbi:MAG: hypothetical protein K8I27_14115 [Planctomycetes bacterium]|nr:hypothetical protein [Planctomycetota bacterium]
MRTMNWMTQRAKWLVPGGVGFCALVLLLDLLAFWVLDRRPLVSSLEMTTVVWSLLIASAFTYAAKWSISGDSRTRVPLAATLLVMIALSALHPWHNGRARDAAAPELPSDRAVLPDVVVFEDGVLTEGEHATY